jgi:DNA-binding IclR family transcriptional regulator
MQSLERAFHILETLDEAGADGMGAQELANTVRLKFPTAHNFLKSLKQLGYIRQIEATGKYAVGAKALSLGRGGAKKRLSDAARPVAEELRSTLNETVTVVFYNDMIWRTLFNCYSTRELAANPRLPVTDNLYISATGRCILSNLPESGFEKYLRIKGLPAGDWDGIDSVEALKKAAAALRARGYEIYKSKSGTVGVGCPIHSTAAGLEAAIGVFLPEIRFSGEHRENIIKGLARAAEEIKIILEN